MGRVCPGCGSEKSEESFVIDTRYGPSRPNRRRAVRSDYEGGLSHVCRPCKAKYDQTYYKSGQKKRPSSSEYRKGKLRRVYGITVEDYDKQLAAQGGTCAMCGRPPKSRNLDIDHDHKTGRLRGLLCHMCNRALAMLRNSPVTAAAAAEYLQNPPWQMDVTGTPSPRKETI